LTERAAAPYIDQARVRTPGLSAIDHDKSHASRGIGRAFRASAEGGQVRHHRRNFAARVLCARRSGGEKCSLTGIADAVNVTDGRQRARPYERARAAAAIMVEEGVEPILQFTCRDPQPIALQSDLLGAITLGDSAISSCCAATDPTKSDQPDAKPVFDLETRDLIALAARLRDEREIPPGRKIGDVPALTIGARRHAG
jgi:hypothetical protein